MFDWLKRYEKRLLTAAIIVAVALPVVVLIVLCFSAGDKDRQVAVQPTSEEDVGAFSQEKEPKEKAESSYETPEPKQPNAQPGEVQLEPKSTKTQQAYGSSVAPDQANTCQTVAPSPDRDQASQPLSPLPPTRVPSLRSLSRPTSLATAPGIAKAPVPNATAQKAALDAVRGLYESQYAEAKTPARKAELARRLLQRAAAATDLDRRYALLRVARDVSIEAFTPTAFEAVDEMAKTYQIDSLEMKTKVLAGCAKTARNWTHHRRVAEAASQLAVKALLDDDFATAGRMAELGAAAAQKASKRSLMWDLRGLQQKIAQVANAHPNMDDLEKAASRIKLVREAEYAAVTRKSSRAISEPPLLPPLEPVAAQLHRMIPTTAGAPSQRQAPVGAGDAPTSGDVKLTRDQAILKLKARMFDFPTHFGVLASLGGTDITDSDLAYVKELDIEFLHLLDSPVTDAGLAHLEGMEELKGVVITYRPITDAGLKHLKGMANLRILRLHSTQITDAGLEHLKGLNNLELLDLTDTQVSNAGLVHLKGMERLKGLYLGSTQVTDAGLKKLQQALPDCEIRYNWLYRDHVKLTRDQTILKLKARISDFPTHFGVLASLGGTDITDSDLAYVKKLHIEFLHLSDSPVTDAGLAHLKGMEELKGLVITDRPITDAGLKHLKGMTDLRVLRLPGTQITDAGLVHLKGLNNLEVLDLSDAQITDAGLVHLKGMERLRVLHIGETQVTDAGLQHIKEMEGLKSVTVGFAADFPGHVSSQGVKWLRQVRPDLWVY